MSAFVDDFGSSHPQSKQVRILVTGLPKFPVLPILAVESSAISETSDTFDTKDGQAHSAGPSSASRDFTFGVYESDTATREAMEYWLGLRDSPLAKVTVVVEYPYADGTKGPAFRLTKAFCVGRETGGSGTAGAAMTTYTLKYQRAPRV